MRTIRAAAQLLADASSLERLEPIAAAAGCAGVPSPLAPELLRELRLPGVDDARIAAGAGAIRALLLSLSRSAPPRELLSRIAARLATRAPHVLWLVLATQPDGDHVAIAAWRGDRRPPRVAALVADRAHIVDSDAETLALLSAASDSRHDADVLTHARWVEILGRESLTRRFYRALERRVSALAASLTRGGEGERRELALLHCSRLLFLAFLEAKGWLDGDRDFLVRGFDACMTSGGRYHRRVLLPLFFGTLNTRRRARAATARAFGRVPFLNGGLFAVTPVERRLRGAHFPDDELGALFGELFARYRFTAREESADWSELAVDPEMLGKAFESLMAASERKSSGSFYTPHALVERVTSAALSRALRISPATCHADDVRALAELQKRELRSSLTELTILDPACGSGAFLVHALERVSELLRAVGDERPPAAIRREVLTRSIFGVDRNPTAVWLCELRLWLSVVIESEIADPLDVPPLPNLDRNVRVGDALAGDGFNEGVASSGDGARLRTLRGRYARASGARKESLARQLDQEERRLALVALEREGVLVTALRRDLISVMRGRDLFGERRSPAAAEREQARALRERSSTLRREKRRLLAGGALPFSFVVHFADVAARGGFDVVVGNPPWVRLHRIPPAERESLRRRYRVYRAAAWEGGAARAHAGLGFAAQVDLAALFVERSLRLLRPGAVLSLLLPVKLWRSLAGGGVRRLLMEESRVLELEDYSDAPATFDAAVYPSLLVAERWSGTDGSETPGQIVAAAHRRGGGPFIWRIPRRTLAFDESPGSPWLALPPDVRDAFERLRASGTPLGESTVGRPHLGVKCGLNLAFVVRRTDRGDGDLACIAAANGRRGVIERLLLRPVVRGETLRAWSAPLSEDFVVWTHGAAGTPLEQLPPHTLRWLQGWRRQLAARADARGARWWSLFRTDAARCDRPRVLWADVGRAPRATLLEAGDPCVPLNSCYAAICRERDDALALAAILNSPLADAWLAALAEPARGGYRRFLGWTMALLPVPSDWQRARSVLAPIAARALDRAGDDPSLRADLLEAALAAYRVRHRDVAPLLAWLDP